MCNLYQMTATVDEMRRVFGGLEGDRDNLPSFGETYPNYKWPVLRRNDQRQEPSKPFWRSALKDPAKRCLVPVTQFCEWTAEPDPETKRKRKVGLGHSDELVFAFAGIWRPGEPSP